MMFFWYMWDWLYDEQCWRYRFAGVTDGWSGWCTRTHAYAMARHCGTFQVQYGGSRSRPTGPKTKVREVWL